MTLLQQSPVQLSLSSRPFPRAGIVPPTAPFLQHQKGEVLGGVCVVSHYRLRPAEFSLSNVTEVWNRCERDSGWGPVHQG